MNGRAWFYSGLRLAFFVLAVTGPLAALAQDRPSRESFLFRHSDSDGDGFLSPGEFLRIHAASSRGGSPDAAFASADSDGDGRLAYEELVAWYRSGR